MRWSKDLRVLTTPEEGKESEGLSHFYWPRPNKLLNRKTLTSLGVLLPLQDTIFIEPNTSFLICLPLLPRYVPLYKRDLRIFSIFSFISCLCLSLKTDEDASICNLLSTVLINFPSYTLTLPRSTPKPNRADQ
jgi:hypothetical protein